MRYKSGEEISISMLDSRVTGHEPPSAMDLQKMKARPNWIFIPWLDRTEERTGSQCAVSGSRRVQLRGWGGLDTGDSTEARPGPPESPIESSES